MQIQINIDRNIEGHEAPAAQVSGAVQSALNPISERITGWGHARRHGRVTQLIGKATDLALETDGVREVVSFLQVT